MEPAHRRVNELRRASRWGCGLVLLALVVMAGTARAQPPPDRLITATSMGDATLGGTDAELSAELGSTYTVAPAAAPFVDLEGVEVQQGATVMFWALHVAGAGPALDVFVTENPEYQLESGIGPGSTIEDAAAVYGTPTVSFDTNTESREFVTFAAGPAGRIQLQVEGPTPGEMAGTYAEPLGERNESTDIAAGSTITRVWISCVGAGCPPRDLPATGAGDATGPIVVVALAFIVAGTMVSATRLRAR